MHLNCRIAPSFVILTILCPFKQLKEILLSVGPEHRLLVRPFTIILGFFNSLFASALLSLANLVLLVSRRQFSFKVLLHVFRPKLDLQLSSSCLLLSQ